MKKESHTTYIENTKTGLCIRCTMKEGEFSSFRVYTPGFAPGYETANLNNLKILRDFLNELPL